MNLNIKSKGFTLVELMVTVGVIGVITAIAIPAYTGYVETSRKVEGQQNLDTLKAAQAEFFAENNTYFSGASTADLITNSNSYWTPAEANEIDREFTYAVAIVAGPPISFTATATGKGNKVPITVVLTYP